MRLLDQTQEKCSGCNAFTLTKTYWSIRDSGAYHTFLVQWIFLRLGLFLKVKILGTNLKVWASKRYWTFTLLLQGGKNIQLNEQKTFFDNMPQPRDILSHPLGTFKLLYIMLYKNVTNVIYYMIYTVFFFFFFVLTQSEFMPGQVIYVRSFLFTHFIKMTLL